MSVCVCEFVCAHVAVKDVVYLLVPVDALTFQRAGCLPHGFYSSVPMLAGRFLRLITNEKQFQDSTGNQQVLEAMAVVPNVSSRLVTCVDPNAITVHVDSLAVPMCNIICCPS